MPITLILASTSPRRRDLLAILGIQFEIISPISLGEVLCEDRSTQEQVRKFALEKAQSVAQQHPCTLVLGGDTLIEVDGKPAGKPQDLQEAEKMLYRLQGRRHLVHSAVGLVREKPQLKECLVETVSVWMKQLGKQDIAQYLKTKESLGKAGAYCIQGQGVKLIEKIEGDYPTVVGLPLRLVAYLLRREGIAIPKNIDEVYQTTPYSNWERFV